MKASQCAGHWVRSQQARLHCYLASLMPASALNPNQPTRSPAGGGAPRHHIQVLLQLMLKSAAVAAAKGVACSLLTSHLYLQRYSLPPAPVCAVPCLPPPSNHPACHSDVGGCDEQIMRLQEVVELPLLHPERFVNLGMEPPRGALLCGPPGTGVGWGLRSWG